METELRDIYGMWYVPFWRTPMFRMGLAALCIFTVLLIVILLIRWWLRTRPRVVVPAWKRALSRLNQVEAPEQSDTKGIMHFYTQVIGILRGYLQERYQHDLSGKTDDELLQSVSTFALGKKTLHLLRLIITEGEEAKFFPISVAMARMREHLSHARCIVTMTAEKEHEAQQKGAQSR